MNRRDMMKLSAAVLASGTMAAHASTSEGPARQYPRWSLVEISLSGPSEGNPFVEIQLSAIFRHGHRSVTVAGFYDGEQRYLIRFMPDEPGEWSWTTQSNHASLAGHSDRFLCTDEARHHGPVTVRNTYHFAFADGTAYFPFGTTCYNWTHVDSKLRDEVLATLATTSFNKVRMCVLPKETGDNVQQASPLPYSSKPDGTQDYTRFNPEFFRHLEDCVAKLGDSNIQADLILFHPYDKLGYNKMPAEAADRYLRYVIARLAAFQNVWWSIANEFDLVKTRSMPDWDHYLRVVQEADPFQHLRSIHHSKTLYDHSKPWVTHASLQTDDFEKAPEWLAAWKKPVLYDECKYEGNLERRWGNLSGEELTRRAWRIVIAGCYVTHGEVYDSDNDHRLWTDAGPLRGQSPNRIAFLRKLLEESTQQGLTAFDSYYLSAGKPGELYLYYFDYHQPRGYSFPLPEEAKFQAELIDTWEMTITPIPGVHSGKTKIKLPAKPFYAVRFRKV